MATLTASAPARDDLAAFAGRVARWDNLTAVRLRQDGDLVRVYAGTPFDALVSRAVPGRLDPADVTVHAGNLVAATAVGRSDDLDLGRSVDAAWRSQLPPTTGWVEVDRIPVPVVSRLADEGTAAARANPGPTGGASTALLDSEVLTVSGGGMQVVLSLRVLFALSGMGFAPQHPDEQVRVAATDAWVRVDARYGSVLRRRFSLLPLLL